MLGASALSSIACPILILQVAHMHGSQHININFACKGVTTRMHYARNCDCVIVHVRSIMCAKPVPYQ